MPESPLSHYLFEILLDFFAKQILSKYHTCWEDIFKYFSTRTLGITCRNAIYYELFCNKVCMFTALSLLINRLKYSLSRFMKAASQSAWWFFLCKYIILYRKYGIFCDTLFLMPTFCEITTYSHTKLRIASFITTYFIAWKFHGFFGQNCISQFCIFLFFIIVYFYLWWK